MVLNEKTPFIENGSIILKKDLKEINTADLLDYFNITGSYLDDVKLTLSLIEKMKHNNADKLFKSKEWCRLEGERIVLYHQFLMIKNEILRRIKND